MCRLPGHARRAQTLDNLLSHVRVAGLFYCASGGIRGCDRFCKACIVSVASAGIGGIVVRCPLCRVLTKLAGASVAEGVLALPTNYALADVIDELAQEKLRAQASRCSVCDDAVSKWSCDQCRIKLCDFCCIAHRKAKVTAPHELSSISDPAVKGPPSADKLGSADAEGRGSALAKCHKHSTQLLDLFCETCSVVVCGFVWLAHRPPLHCPAAPLRLFP